MLMITLEQGLIISNCALLVFSVFSSVLVYRKSKKQITTLHQQLKHTQTEYSALAKSSLGVGRRLKKLEQRMLQGQVTGFNTSDEAIYQQAQKLVDLGASAEDLVNNCGVARAEAELLVTLQRQTTH